MAGTNRIFFEPLRTIDSVTFTGAYQKLGTPLANPSYIVKLVNNSNVLVTISLDGITDMDILPANSFTLYDEDTSGEPSPEALPTGTQFWIKGAAGGLNAGSVYLTSIFVV